MPAHSKFTAETKQKILQALTVGAPRTIASAIAGVDQRQLRRWLERGKDAEEGTSFREFYEDVLKAEASPGMRALGVVYKELPDNPALAWKFVERRVPGYEPPMPDHAPAAAPVVVQLSFADGGMPPLMRASPELLDGIIDGEVVEDAEDSEADADQGEST